jgi:hypothetical protein
LGHALGRTGESAWTAGTGQGSLNVFFLN